MQITMEPEPVSASSDINDFDAQIQREWLITNGRGGYASGTVSGVPTRRYHGLLVAAARPPLERWLLLSAMLERVGIGGKCYELANFEFDDTIHPQGYRYLTDFVASNNRTLPWVRFVYEPGDLRLTKELFLSRQSDEVSIRYRLEGPSDENLSFELCPFLAMRDFHSLTRAFSAGYHTSLIDEFVAVDAYSEGPRLWLSASVGGADEPMDFEQCPNWWHRLTYRQESARGLDAREDLFSPGWFRASGIGCVEVVFRAVAGFGQKMQVVPASAIELCIPESPAEPTVEDRLCEAADAFVVERRCPNDKPLTTILAGYHWFGDWGRDTFIALPGLLLETKRFTEARQVLEVFASAERDGLIPNRFSDYGDGRDYNSVDASLWFVHGADAYCASSGDEQAWLDILGPTCERIVDAFAAGTKFNIHMNDDGLIACGDATTQLTWMDAKAGDVVFTPRHGKPVEINALWYHALCILATRMDELGSPKAVHYRQMASQARGAFLGTFWNGSNRSLYDVVRDDWRDLAVRPNQIFAVSLPHTPLNEDQQRAVLDIVGRELLTPYGLRSLAASHPSYHGRYGGGPFERDSVYHQGTVWGWLMGPYVEAYLRVHGFSAEAKARMREVISPLVEHLDQAGIDSVSEIFDGDPPHTPRGTIAQAWSVAELLRAWRMTSP